MGYVIGVDLGTSAVKTILVNKSGEVVAESSKEFSLYQEKTGYSEQNPEDWVVQTAAAIQELIEISGIHSNEVEGLSYSGQMHGMVLLDSNRKVLRKAILWNDTRTTKQCRDIENTLGERLLQIAKNPALEGFTLPKILWVKENEPDIFRKADVFLLPKDYLRYRMTNQIHCEYSDAAGTLLLDVINKKWSEEICAAFGINEKMCPPLVESTAQVGAISEEFARLSGLSTSTKVFAGGADNACGAIGAGILKEGLTLCSIGTSGVILSYETDKNRDFEGKVHFFNHGEPDAFYTMGVTLAAGYSFSWFRNQFAPNRSYDELTEKASKSSLGSNGLLFTPYIMGERTPHPDSMIRGSFIGVDGSHQLGDFARAVIEGVTFSLNESISIFREAGKSVSQVISIGGGAKSDLWLQIQADVFNAEILVLENEQGPSMGASMIAAVGCGWFTSLQDCSEKFVRVSRTYQPNPNQVEQYQELFHAYQKVYHATKEINHLLVPLRK